MTRHIVDNDKLSPWFTSDQKKSLQAAAGDVVVASVQAVQPTIQALDALIRDFTVSPVTYSFTASAGQTSFQVGGVATDQGELVLVFRNGLRLRPSFDYTTSFTLSPQVTTITLTTPAALNDVIAGVIYNIAVDSLGAVDVQARSDISALHTNPILGNTSEVIDDRVAALAVAGANMAITYNDVAHTLTFAANVGATNLDALTDVVITSPLVGHVLKWNGSVWVNEADATGAGSGNTNLSFTRTAADVTILSDTGLDATVPSATDTFAGVMSAAQAAKLNGIATGATANAADSALRDRATHTGTQALGTLAPSGAGVGQVPTWNGTAWAPATPAGGGGGSGTVTSVGFQAADASLSVSGSPISTSGTISVTLNTVPITRGGTGAVDAASARANLGLGTAATQAATAFAAASHGHDASHVTSGTLPVARGGTGVTASTGTGSVVLNNGPAFAGTASFAIITASGSITSQGDVIANSDERLKTLERTLLLSLEDMSLVNAFDYTLNRNSHKSSGVVAQHIQKILPRLVIVGEDGFLSVDYGKVGTCLALNLVRELKQEKQRNDALEARLASIEALLGRG